MSIIFTALEIEYLQKDPDALRSAAMYHELNILQAQSMTGNDELCEGNISRQKELNSEAEKIEGEY